MGDVERNVEDIAAPNVRDAKEYSTNFDETLESESLLPVTTSTKGAPRTSRSKNVLSILAAFLGGFLSCMAVQWLVPSFCLSSNLPSNVMNAFHDSNAGSPVSHEYPPPSPTNKFPDHFPTDVGYAGPTPTGAEPGVVATGVQYPLHTGAPNLLGPSKPLKSTNEGHGGFDIFQSWGNLSPWYSVPSKAFGLNTSPEAPETCRVTGLHLLHRHGARYPTEWSSFGGPARFAARLRNTTSSAKGWKATGQLGFLNDWTYKLGAELLTPFGRQQLFDLGVSTRIKYGFLLQNFTEKNALPVFRTESQDRMLYSALNFAIGFFGYPIEDKYLQSITIEANGFNNTLCPYKTCPNANIANKADRAMPYLREWTSIYLKDALARLQPHLEGLELSIEDIYVLQQLCAYETVALGYSKFCELFTIEEWEGFEYALDLFFWYDSGFGSPVARVQGVGYVQELVSRLTQTRIEVHNTSTNKTLDDDDTTFPFGNSLYVDATHEVVIMNIITALNLTNFAEDGPLPSTHIPRHRKFITSQLIPFAANVQFQLLSCSTLPDPQIRVIINDGVSPLTGIEGCPKNRHGMCPVDTFVGAQKKLIKQTDWEWGCHGDWDLPAGSKWNTTTGDPPVQI